MADKPRILVVDDEADLRATLAEYLDLHGFDVHVAEDGASMRRLVAERAPDLVILDLNLPHEDGLSLTRWLRATSQVGILMLTAHADPLDRVVGIEVGAHDYMAKPFLPRELLARVRSILRRVRTAIPEVSALPERVRFGRCLLDMRSGKLLGDDGAEQQLTGMEFDLLKAFAAHPNQILSRDRLLDLAHNRDWDPFDRSVDVRITRIRKKIEPDPVHPQIIKTVRGAGYIFEPGT
jgi:two-component system phosphate regulon response regulator OmpR